MSPTELADENPSPGFLYISDWWLSIGPCRVRSLPCEPKMQNLSKVRMIGDREAFRVREKCEDVGACLDSLSRDEVTTKPEADFSAY